MLHNLSSTYDFYKLPFNLCSENNFFPDCR